MKTKEKLQEGLYKKVYINSKDDLPKETRCRCYFAHGATGDTLIWWNASQVEYWDDIEWYLIPVAELKEATPQVTPQDTPQGAEEIFEIIERFLEDNDIGLMVLPRELIAELANKLEEYRQQGIPTEEEIHTWADTESLVDDEDNEGSKRIDAFKWEFLVDGAKWILNKWKGD